MAVITKLKDNRTTYGEKITDRIWADNNGQLIIRDAIVARTGTYEYAENEVIDNGDPNKIVKVYRTEEEVFDPKAIASFENKPFCNDHPDEDVCPYNYKDLQVGFIRNIKRGTGELDNCLLCDIVVMDPEVIELIKNGDKRELSLGYNTNIVLEDGKYLMKDIRGNHLALVDSGRAGNATIRDSKMNTEIKKENKMGLFKNNDKTKKPSFLKRLLDEGEVIEVEEVTEEPEEEKVDIEELADEGAEGDQLSLLKDIKGLLEQLVAAIPTASADEDVEGEEEVVAEEEVEDEEAIEEEEVTEEEVADEEEEVMDVVEVEEVSDEELSDEDAEEEVSEDADEDEEVVTDEAEGELLDADAEVIEDVKPVAKDKKPAAVAKDKKVIKPAVKAKDKSVHTYSIFTGVTDKKVNDGAMSVEESFRQRYNKIQKGEKQ